jgi:hypothetical protein
MNQLRTDAERLRDQGYSYNMISETLGISKSTMSYWFKDRPFTPNYEVVERIKYGPLKSGTMKHNKKVEEITKFRKIGVREVGRLSDRDLWMLGLGLYIGEGAKTIEAIRISNSDPAVVAVAIRWLKECCGLADNNLSIRLHLYPDNDVDSSIEYWQAVTKLPLERFKKTYIDSRDNKKHSSRGKLPHGTAHVSVVSRGNPDRGVRLYRRLNGWMAGALEQL